MAAIVTLLAAPAHADVVGRASVVDGDTIEIAGERIRFNGIDAPESWPYCLDRDGAEYSCGKVAADALDAFLAESRPTACKELDRDRYRRTVAECFRADGASVNARLVRNGYALDWPRYSNGPLRRRAGRSGTRETRSVAGSVRRAVGGTGKQVEASSGLREVA